MIYDYAEAIIPIMQLTIFAFFLCAVVYFFYNFYKEHKNNKK